MTVSPLAALTGAVVPDGASLPSHYGNPFQEEELLANAAQSFTDLSTIEILEVSGQDRMNWLHNITTCDFHGLNPGDSSELLVLDANGHIEHAAGVYVGDEAVYLLCDEGRSAALADFLNSMRFMLRVEVTPQPELAAIGVVGDMLDSLEKLVELTEFTWVDPWPGSEGDEGSIHPHYGVNWAKHPGLGWGLRVIVMDRENLLATARALVAAGHKPVGTIAFEAHRITSWRPRPNAEIVERVLPHELDWLRSAVHVTKRCYRGQETVAKLVNLGRPPRRLVYLSLEGPETDLPEAGTPVTVGEKTVGFVTSSARSWADGPVALAVVKRSTAPDAVLTAGAFVAGQQEIVSAEGKSSVSPTERPGAGLRRIKPTEGLL